MLNDNQRRIVEGIRRCGAITIEAGAGHSSLELKIKDKDFSHDVAIAVQKYFNDLNKQHENGNL